MGRRKHAERQPDDQRHEEAGQGELEGRREPFEHEPEDGPVLDVRVPEVALHEAGRYAPSWTRNGWSSPSAWRIRSTSSGVARMPAIIRAGSAGRMKVTKKVRTAIANRTTTDQPSRRRM